MLWTRDKDSDSPPLSAILPRLYLGAERDVTQDGLASLGISYVLSVSRCSPQPSFLPRSRYLRIPIDDSLWADLLPWIPPALSFIDSAISSGASVLVHCAAGISRSPALAVAYIMYRLGLDLDQAYRFVKERRPSISPNFNFLGQLQSFQSTLGLKTSAGKLLPPQVDIGHAHNEQRIELDCRDLGQLWQVDSEPTHRDQQRLQDEVKCTQAPPPSKPAAKPTKLQLPACSASLQDKRKSLTLSLTPLVVSPPSRTVNRETEIRGPTDPETPLREHASPRKDERHSAPTRKEQSVPSPLGCSLHRLLGWAERLLLGGLFPPIRMGQPALPYRC